MRNYDFNKLLDSRTFEFFGKAIIEKLENKRFEIFSEGKDKGIDLRNVENGYIIIGQVKRYKNFNSLLSELKSDELPKVEKLNPNRYILITSVDLSVDKKEKIKEVFEKYILNTSDIIGSEELNALLEKDEFKMIEDEYYQLWINSTNTLKNFIKKELNSDIYNYTRDELENIKQATNVYIRNGDFSKALKLIKKNRCLLICGEPGVGKSILARNLCAYLMNKNKETEFIYLNKISDIAKLLTDGKSQIFFVDDFWGSKFVDNLKGEEEKILKHIIEIINKSEDKILILTCREYILEQGYAEYPELEEFFDKYKLKLYIENYSDLFKAQILFKHLSNSNLSHDAIYQIAYGYEWIINNQNYSPRIIENYIDYVSEKEIEPENYLTDLIDYLNHPNKLWKGVFYKQCEGAQLILILILLSGEYNIDLENVRTYFNRYLDYPTKVQARKKDFMRYIAQLENTLITTHQEEWVRKQKVFVEFKNSSIELFIYQYFTENIEEYVDNLINGAPFINNLLYLIGSWNVIEKSSSKVWEYEKIKIDTKMTKLLKDKIIEKVMNDYDNLKVNYEDETDCYKEADENYVHKLILVMQFYKIDKNEKLKEWLKNRIIAILQDLETNPYFDYEALFDIPTLVKESISQGIYTQIDVNKVIKDTFQAIRFSRQISILENFEEEFPKEYEEFFSESKSDIISAIYNLTLEDAEFFIEDGCYADLDELRDMVIPDLFEKYNLKYTKEYMDEFYNITEERLIADTRGRKKKKGNLAVEYDREDSEREYEERQIQREQEEKMIEQERKKLIDSLYEDMIEDDDVKKFFQEHIENKELVNELVELFHNYEKNYIRAFMDEWDSLEILAEFINDIPYIPNDSKEFFEKFIFYIQQSNHNITDKVIQYLQKIAYQTFQEGRNKIFKRELLEKIDEDIIDELEESGLIYCIHNKYYFQTIYLHLYLALKEMIEKKEPLENIYQGWKKESFSDLFNDICYTYADINLEKFNADFLIPQIKKVIQNINDKSAIKQVQKLVKLYKIQLDLDTNVDPEEDWIYSGSTITPDCSLLALEYLGFQTSDFVNDLTNMETVRILSEKAYNGNTEITVDLPEALADKNSAKYQLMEQLGVINYLTLFCDYLKKCLEDLENNRDNNLRMTFSI